MTAPQPSLIGIDGGATTCRFAMLHDGHRFDVRLDGANASSDRAGAVVTLRDGLSALAEVAGIAPQDLKKMPTFIGLAGVVDQDIAAGIARDLPLDRAEVEDDRRTAMTGALGGLDGCVMGIGTGSFLGRRAGGADRFVGGRGLILGDEASGAYLGRQLLRRALAVHDGTEAASPLTREIIAEHNTPAALVAFAATATPRDFAHYAPRIVEGAQAGDTTARALILEGAQYIERMLSHLGWQPGERICPLGGLAPHYAEFLKPDITAHISVPDGTALDGALHLAAQMDGP